MCDPLSAIALAGSAVAAGVNYMGQQDTLAAQKSANEDWLTTQQNASKAAAAKDLANQQKSNAALSVAEQQVGPANQQATQQTAQNNLTTQMLAGSPAASDSNISLLGGDAADTSVSSDMASRVTNAAREAQGRIKALAGLTSYGGGYGDMGAQAGQALADSGEAINMYSDFRQGDTRTLGVTQAIQPVHYEQGSNIAGSLAGSLAGMAGNAFGKSMKG